MLRVNDIIQCLEEAFPPRYQEDFDNTGLQVGSPYRVCTGVLLCVDVTPEIVVEAAELGYNLIVTHHPLIFKPLRSIGPFGRINQSIIKAIRNDIAIYSCHTSVDNTPHTGVSWKIGELLGLTDIKALEERGADGIGSGVVGNLPSPMLPLDLIDKIKATFSSPVARCSAVTHPDKPISRVALCGGAGSFLIPKAVADGAEVFICSDCKHNEFLDHIDRILLVDIGHYESEECTKQIFYHTIKEKFPNFALYFSKLESNPITYL